MTNIDKIIHEEMLPIRQMFVSYSELAKNPLIHFDPKVFKKCAMKIEELIGILREVV